MAESPLNRSPSNSPRTPQRGALRLGGGAGGGSGLHVALPPRHPRSGSSRALLTPGGSFNAAQSPVASPPAVSVAPQQLHRPHVVSTLPRIVTRRTIPTPTPAAAASLPLDSLDRISLKHDLKVLLGLALPASSIFAVQFLVSFSSVLFIGRLGPEYLGAATLANMLANLTGFSIGQGATTALDALCSQAYGARSYALVGRHTQRALFILSLACIPVAAVWWRTDTILRWMGVEPRICDLAGMYTRILIAGCWPNFASECLRRFLQAQSILWPVVVAAVVTALSSIGLNCLFMYVFEWGFEGPAIAAALSQWIMLLTIVACMVGNTHWRRWQSAAAAGRSESGVQRGRARRMGGETYSQVSSPRVEDASVVCISPPPALSPQSPGGWDASLPSSPTVEMALLKNRQHMRAQLQQQHMHAQVEPSIDVHSPSPDPLDPLTAPSSSTDGTLLLPAVTLDDTWPSIWSREVLTGWNEFLKLAIPGAASLFVEWGSYEVSASMAARLGTTNLAVHSIFMQTAGLFYTIPLGTATACSITVGLMLGAGRGDRARDFARLGLYLNLAFPLLSASILVLALRHVWGLMFTSDAAVSTLCYDTLPILFLYLFFDHLKCMCMAVLRGCGRAPITVWGNTLACWLVGFPLAYVLVFNPLHWELTGLWVAMSAAWATACLLYTAVIGRTDWEQEVRDARGRTERSLATEPASAAVDLIAANSDFVDSRVETDSLQLDTLPSSPAVSFTIRDNEDADADDDAEGEGDEVEEWASGAAAAEDVALTNGFAHASSDSADFDVHLHSLDDHHGDDAHLIMNDITSAHFQPVATRA